MGKARTCDKRCHGAKRPRCRCWCGGKFHGAAGAEARAEFMSKYVALPEQQAEYEATLNQRQLFPDDQRAVRPI